MAWAARSWRITYFDYVGFRSSGASFHRSSTPLQFHISACKFIGPLGRQAEAGLDLGIILLGLIGLVIVLALIPVVTKMASDQDSAWRRKNGAPDTQ